MLQRDFLKLDVRASPWRKSSFRTAGHRHRTSRCRLPQTPASGPISHPDAAEPNPSYQCDPVLIATDKKIAHAKVGYFFDSGGEDGNRTRLNGFAGRIDELKINGLHQNLLFHLPSPVEMTFLQRFYLARQCKLSDNICLPRNIISVDSASTSLVSWNASSSFASPRQMADRHCKHSHSGMAGLRYQSEFYDRVRIGRCP